MEDFLRSLNTCGGPRLTSRIGGDWAGLYSAFLSGPQFVAWLGRRERECTERLHRLYLDALLEADFHGHWLYGAGGCSGQLLAVTSSASCRARSEVEVLDMIMQLDKQIVSSLECLFLY